MAVYVVKTKNHDIERTKRLEPYKSFLQRFRGISKENPDDQEEIFLYLAHGVKGNTVTAFTEDGSYFGNPVSKFSFHRVNGGEGEQYLIRHRLEFEYDDSCLDVVSGALKDIKAKQKYLFLPGVKELELTYAMDDEQAEIIVNAVVDKFEQIEEVSMMLISLDICLFARGW